MSDENPKSKRKGKNVGGISAPRMLGAPKNPPGIQHKNRPDSPGLVGSDLLTGKRFSKLIK